ncbi:MAG: fimbrillin family protein, partial [Alistipes sp.]|nr:fimbrillin family protein [Alistipes sp.]
MTTIEKRFFRPWRAGALGLLAAAGITLLGGCSKEDGTSDGDRTAVRFQAGITATTRTTDGGDRWKEGDPVGIFMLRSGGTLSDDGAVYEKNVKYTVSNPTTGELGGETTIYYPAGNGSVDFIAYYPHSTTITDDYKYPVPLSDQRDPAVIDLLYARAEGKSRTSETVGLTFGHALSKVTFNVKLGVGFTAAATVTDAAIGGMPASATMALQNGAVEAGAVGEIVLLKAEAAADGCAATFSAIIVPQGANAYAGRKAVFTIDGVSYEGSLPDGDAFEKSNHYTYPVTVNETGVSFGEPSIGEWDTNPQNTSEVTEMDIETVFIRAGTFLMGSPETEPNRNPNETQHRVTLTQDFYMSKYEITNAQYAAFLNAVGVGQDGKWSDWSDDANKTQVLIRAYQWGLKWDAGSWKPEDGYANHPVVYVTWYGAKAYADWIGGSLPTEAQWEYACRAGTTTAYSFGDSEGDLDTYAWYSSNSGNTTHEVGDKQPNPWGLYDMHGNVYEWCLDSWDGRTAYSPEDATDPVSPNPGS